MAAMYLTDAETAFRDSPEGREAIAYAKSCRETGHPSSRSWSDADEVAVIQSAMVTRDFHRWQAADQAARQPVLEAKADTALHLVHARNR